MLTFDVCKHDGVLAKLMQFNGEMHASGEATPLDESQAAALAKLVGTLKQPNRFHATSVSAAELALFTSSRGLLSWPLPRLFPCVDLFRLLVLHPSVAQHLSTSAPPLVPRLLRLLAVAQTAAAADDKPAAAAVLMLLRTCANLVSRYELRPMVASSASSLVDVLSAPIESGPTQPRLAAVSILFNVCMLLSAKDLAPETALQMDGVALQALSLLQLALSVPALLEPTEEESLFRLLATLNALLEVEGMLVTAKELELHVTLGALALSAAAPPKTVACKEAALKLLTK